MQPIPRVDDYMTSAPYTIDSGQDLATAGQLMRLHEVRHLPVLDQGELVGILSERDYALASGLDGVDPEEVTAGEAMTAEPFAVEPDSPLDEVVGAMHRHHYGCAVIMRGTEVVGIFTTIDALRALGDQLRRRRSDRP